MLRRACQQLIVSVGHIHFVSVVLILAFIISPFTALLLRPSALHAQQPEVLFRDDFEDRLNPAWDLQEGWAVQSLEDGDHVLTGTGSYPWAALQIGQDWTDYTLSFDMRISDPNGALNMNLRIIRQGNARHRYVLYLNRTNTSLSYDLLMADTWQNLTKGFSPVNLSDGNWHRVTITVQGQRLQMMVDDQPALDFTIRGDVFLNGSIAFESSMDQAPEGATVQIDDVLVTEVPPSPYILADGTLDKQMLILRLQSMIASGSGAIQGEQYLTAMQTLEEALALAREYVDHEAFASDAQPTPVKLAEVDAVIGLGEATFRLVEVGSPSQRALTEDRENAILTAADVAKIIDLQDFPESAAEILTLAFEDADAARDELDDYVDNMLPYSDPRMEETVRAQLLSLFALIEAGDQYLAGDYDAALETLDTSVVPIPKGESAGELVNIAVPAYYALIYEQQGNLREAHNAWRMVLNINSAQGLNREIVHWHTFAVDMYDQIFAEFIQAEKQLTDAVATSEAVGDPERIGQAQMRLGWLYQMAGQYIAPMPLPARWANWESLADRMWQAYSAAAAAFEQAGNRHWQANALVYKGQQERTFGDWSSNPGAGFDTEGWYQEALTSLREAVRVRGDDWERYELCETLLVIVQRLHTHTFESDTLVIDDLLAEQRTVANGMYDGNWELPYLRGMANAWQALRAQDTDLAWTAIADMQQGVARRREIYEEYSDTWQEVRLITAESTLARLYQLVGRPAQALDYFEPAAARVQALPEVGFEFRPEWPGTILEARLHEQYGHALSNVGRYQDAIDAFSQVQLLLKDGRSDELPAGKTNPAYGPALVGMSEAYTALGRYYDSLNTLEELQDFHDRVLTHLDAKRDSMDPALYEAQVLAYQKGKIDALLRTVTPLLVVGRAEAALVNMQRALEQATALGDRAALVDTHLRLGDIYLALGDQDNAITHYTQTADLALQANMPLQRGQALLGLGRIQMQRDQLNDARNTLYQALQAAQNARSPQTEVQVLTAQGDLALLGDPPDLAGAKQTYERALAVAERAEDPALAVDALIQIGGIDAQTETVLDASLIYHEALARAEYISDREALAQIHGRLGQLMQRDDRLDMAEAHFAEAANLVEEAQRGFQSDTLQTQFAANYAWIYTSYVEMLFDAGQAKQAFAVAERARARAFLDQLAAGPLVLSEDSLGALLADEERLRLRLAAARDLLREALRATPPDREYVAQVRAEVLAVENDYVALFNRLQAEHPQLATLTGVQVASLGEIQAMLDADTTLVSYFVGEQRVFAFVIRSDTFRAVELPATREQITTLVELFRADETQTGGLTELHEWLIQPLRPQLSTSRVMIVPHNVLHYLPFAALMNADGEPYSDEAAISYLPSATALLYLPETSTESGDLLALGNPAVEGLRPLRFAEAEVQTVAEVLGGEPLVGDSATESAVVERGSAARVLYIAAHGEFNPRTPLFSRLYLTPDDDQDGLLEAHEIYRLDLKGTTALVVLSACETGVGALSAGDEFASLSRAFHFAGASNVIATLWSVDDAATALLMQAFFEAHASGADYAGALQQAQAAVRSHTDDNGSTPYVAPYYWAGFVLTGRG